MVYWVVFEATKDNVRGKYAIPIQLTGKVKITETLDIRQFEQVIKNNDYLDAVIIDWKEIGLQDTIHLKIAEQS